MQAKAASKAKFTIKKVVAVDQKYGNTKVESYYKNVVLKGKSKAIKKINKAIQKDCTKFIKSQSVKDLVNYAKDSSYDECTYKYTASSKITYNQNGIISIKVYTIWYAGGVTNTDKYGMTFSLKTGKKLYLNQVCADKPEKIAAKLRTKILKEDPQPDLRKVTKNNVKKMDFYLKPKNKVIVCFGPYELGSGGWYRAYTLKSKWK